MNNTQWCAAINRKLLVVGMALVCGLVLAGCRTPATPTAVPSTVAVTSPTATPAPTATATATMVPTAVASPTPTPPPTITPNTPTFYVSVDGDDKLGDGTRGRPWATITHAVLLVPDGATVLVLPGVYNGRVDLRGQFATGITVRAAVPYQSILRHNDTVVIAFYAQGITLEGFDIAHTGTGSQFYVVQIQDFLRDQTNGTQHTSRITLRNNILHDSYDRDILKINNGARQIVVEGNLFYNHGTRGHQIDVNSAADVVIQDNILLNDYAASGRDIPTTTASFIGIKDSNAANDDILASQAITVRRNIFLNWQGSAGSHFLQVGEDTATYHQARDVLVENNLFLGNSAEVMLSAWAVKGARNITFRHNTLTGDLPSFAFAMRLSTNANNQPNQFIHFYNNIFTDPTGTMGQANAVDPSRFSLTPPDQTDSFELRNNLYWNGGIGLPLDPPQLIHYTDDAQRVIGDPYLDDPAALVVPHWSAADQQFGDGSYTIREAFLRLVALYGTPTPGGAGVGTADPNYAAEEDILGHPRGDNPDMGAVQGN